MSDLSVVSEEILAAYVGKIAVSTAGVFGMGYVGAASALAKTPLGIDKKTRGVRVAQGEEPGYTIDVYIVVDFGVNIPETAWNLQKRAATGLAEVFGVAVKDVNIHVQGVRARGDDEQAGVA